MRAAANYHPDYPQGYKTKRQWAKCGYLPIDDDLGKREYINGNYQGTAIYYTKTQVRKASSDEIKEYLKPYTEHRNELSRWYYRKKRNKELLRRAAASTDYVVCDNPSGVIVMDLETTGLDASKDEVLQISIIGEDGNILINELVRQAGQRAGDRRSR